MVVAAVGLSATDLEGGIVGMRARWGIGYNAISEISG
jgi:hypothetical protein